MGAAAGEGGQDSRVTPGYLEEGGTTTGIGRWARGAGWPAWVVGARAVRGMREVSNTYSPLRDAG